MITQTTGTDWKFSLRAHQPGTPWLLTVTANANQISQHWLSQTDIETDTNILARIMSVPMSVSWYAAFSELLHHNARDATKHLEMHGKARSAPQCRPIAGSSEHNCAATAPSGLYAWLCHTFSSNRPIWWKCITSGFFQICTRSDSRGNNYKLLNHTFHYDLRKHFYSTYC